MTDANRHIGTISTTASGSFQLSYCAASTRNTNSADAPNISMRRVARLLLLEGQFGPFEPDAGRQHLLGEFLHPLQRRAVATPGAATPSTSAAGNRL